jgi:gamma-glutamyltranspeptidase/glutathione hydrolase
MVVTAEPLATQAGLEILDAGGNAFDAAAAVGFALAVTLPRAGNLGGGGFAVGLEDNGQAFALDFRETAPAAAHRDMFLDETGEVVRGRSLYTHSAVGVPGTVDGLLRIHAERGRLPRERVIAPAVRLARNGFPVSEVLAKSVHARRELLSAHAAAAALFLPDGSPIAEGDTLRQEDLARTLLRISRDGRDGFYAGETARLVAAEMARGGGMMTAADLASYQSIPREPFRIQSGGHEILTHPLPSSGGVVLAQILGLVDWETLRAAGPHSAAYVRSLVEAERLAYADRNHHLGDPAFASVPVEMLVSEPYLSARRRLIPPDSAGSSDRVSAGDPPLPESEETTHYCVCDSFGNVASITTTLNGSYGSGIVVAGAGFLLNNEMDDFSAKPGVPNLYGLVGTEANSIAAGKRMLSSMTPSIVLKDDRFLLALGSPGGSTIITTVLQVFLNATLFAMDLEHAVHAPRFHHQWLPDVVFAEETALPESTRASLRTLGYNLRDRSPIGRVAAIGRLPDGSLVGVFDRRGAGLAEGR